MVRPSVFGLLVGQHGLRPDQAFLIREEDALTLTYREVRARVEALSAIFAEHDLSAGDRLIVILPNRLLFPLVYLAALAQGLVVVPVGPEVSGRELSRLIDLALPQAILIDASLKHTLRPSLSHDRQLATISPLDSEEALLFRVGEHQGAFSGAAEVLFTSGTTGAPKAVALTEQQLLFTARQVVQAHSLTSEDVCYLPLPLYHINAQVVGVLATLASGGQLVIASGFSASGFWPAIGRFAVTWVNAVPPILAILAKGPQPAAAPACLRFVRSASAPLPVSVLRAFEEAFSVPVIETYGLTEAASQVAANPLLDGARKPGSVGIGRGVMIRILGERGEALPTGAVGEVAVSGPGVIHGYAHGENRSFLGDWFLTGDLGRLDEDGYLFLTGRKSELINRGGQKVSPREVEEVLLDHPLVQDVAVAGTPDPILGEQVTAWLVLVSGTDPAEAAVALRDHAERHLSPFKRPESYRFVQALPKGSTGKVQRHLLSAEQGPD